MKYIKTILLSINSILCMSAGASVAPLNSGPTMESQLMGPFDGKANETVAIKFGNVDGITRFNINYYTNSTNALVISENHDMNKVLSKDTYIYTLQLRKRLTAKGLRIEFSFYKESEKVNTYKVLLYPGVSNSINGFDYIYNPYVIENTTFKFDRDIVTCTSESYKFDNTLDSLPIGNSNEINIEEMMFSFDANFTIKQESGNSFLKVKDQYNLYTNIPKDSDSCFNIPISLYQINNEVHFSFANKMYVNPNTLDMSMDYKLGYVETSKFYIPPKNIEKFEEGDFEFLLNGVTSNDLTISLPMKIEVSKNIIGFCHDSKYCFSGGVKE